MGMRVIGLLVLVLAVSAALPAVSFTAASATAQRGATVVIPISIQATGAEQPASLQFDVTFDSQVMSFVSYDDGPATSAAGKQGNTSPQSAGVVRVIIAGVNANIIANGVISNMTFSVSPTAAIGPSTVGFTGIEVSDPVAQPIAPNSGNSGTLDVVSGPPTYIGPVNDILTSAGATIGVEVELDADSSVEVSGINFSVTYNPAVLSYTASTAGAVLTTAGKSLTANMTSPGNLTVAISGATQTAIANGVMLSIGFTVNSATSGGAQATVSLNNIVATKPNSSAVDNIITDSAIVTVPRVSLAAPSTGLKARLNQPFALPLHLNHHGSNPVAVGFQVDIEFDDNIFTYVSATEGSAASTAGKQASAALLQGTTNVVRVLLAGVNTTAIADGQAVVLNFTVKGTAPLGETRFYLDEFLATDGNAQGIPFSATLDPRAEVTAFDPEDVNQDGMVNVVDVQTTVNIILGTQPPAYLGQGDANGDGQVNVVDVQTIVNKILAP